MSEARNLSASRPSRLAYASRPSRMVSASGGPSRLASTGPLAPADHLLNTDRSASSAPSSSFVQLAQALGVAPPKAKQFLQSVAVGKNPSAMAPIELALAQQHHLDPQVAKRLLDSARFSLGISPLGGPPAASFTAAPTTTTTAAPSAPLANAGSMMNVGSSHQASAGPSANAGRPSLFDRFAEMHPYKAKKFLRSVAVFRNDSPMELAKRHGLDENLTRGLLLEVKKLLYLEQRRSTTVPTTTVAPGRNPTMPTTAAPGRDPITLVSPGRNSASTALVALVPQEPQGPAASSTAAPKATTDPGRNPTTTAAPSRNSTAPGAPDPQEPQGSVASTKAAPKATAHSGRIPTTTADSLAGASDIVGALAAVAKAQGIDPDMADFFHEEMARVRQKDPSSGYDKVTSAAQKCGIDPQDAEVLIRAKDTFSMVSRETVTAPAPPPMPAPLPFPILATAPTTAPPTPAQTPAPTTNPARVETKAPTTEQATQMRAPTQLPAPLPAPALVETPSPVAAPSPAQNTAPGPAKITEPIATPVPVPTARSQVPMIEWLGALVALDEKTIIHQIAPITATISEFLASGGTKDNSLTENAEPESSLFGLHFNALTSGLSLDDIDVSPMPHKAAVKSPDMNDESSVFDNMSFSEVASYLDIDVSPLSIGVSQKRAGAGTSKSKTPSPNMQRLIARFSDFSDIHSTGSGKKSCSTPSKLGLPPPRRLHKDSPDNKMGRTANASTSEEEATKSKPAPNDELGIKSGLSDHGKVGPATDEKDANTVTDESIQDDEAVARRTFIDVLMKLLPKVFLCHEKCNKESHKFCVQYGDDAFKFLQTTGCTTMVNGKQCTIIDLNVFQEFGRTKCTAYQNAREKHIDCIMAFENVSKTRARKMLPANLIPPKS